MVLSVMRIHYMRDCCAEQCFVTTCRKAVVDSVRLRFTKISAIIRSKPSSYRKVTDIAAASH